MSDDSGMTRRTVLRAGAASLAVAAVSDLTSLTSALATGGPTPGVNYFARFGVTEKMIRETLSAALSRGGEYADVFFQHRLTNSMTLEDGAVNRANSSVGLGVGVRVVKGIQTGYGFTEDLTPAALKRAALTAAAIAEGPAKRAPMRLNVTEKPDRYPVKMRWDEVRPQQKLEILSALNKKTFDADKRVQKVNLSFMDQSSAILVADSTGRIVEDFQPMTSLYLGCVAEQEGRKENNNVNLASRSDLGFYTPERLFTVEARLGFVPPDRPASGVDFLRDPGPRLF